jgi:hypothetical protein
MTFWLVDPDPDLDPDPPIFVITLQDANKKNNKNKCFLLITYFLKVYLCTSFIKDKKVKKKSQTLGIKIFLTIFA